ncbi:MAG: SGNH/GDSL hydrolase family protein [Corallococcus sp.]|nr:SGNH/GDSL hydrolase family protein [Corallococcus sp.]MCM1359828.1 SGNH/GDSL hydrolase family protein [Corallococcus sp.]MCM1395262.1 SGNH/GDSL hydrolase family protein [Corallococcus sp.]
MKYAAALLVMVAVLGLCFAGCNLNSSDDLSKYIIVYSEIDRDELNCLQNSGYDEGCDFYLYCAERLQKIIKNKFDVELPVCLDSSSKESANEILIGKTNRKQTALSKLDSLKEQEYVLVENGGKLVVCGGSYGETWQAVGFLEQNLQQSDAALSSNGVVHGFEQKGGLTLTTIACIGDSLTWGAQSISEKYLSYPAILQRAVWKNCIVKKYANPGKTMNSLVDYSALVCGFTQTGEWNQCLDDAATFDYAIVMLGTNDSWCINLPYVDERPWLTNYEQAFTDSFLQMLSDISEVNTEVKYTLMNCPRVYANGYDTGEICNYQANCVSAALAEGYDVDLFDMAAKTRTLNQTVYYDADGLHFNTKGYAYVAKLVEEMLSEKIELEV